MSAFRVSHARNAKFARRGLRGYFEYRDLGIKRATGGKVVAHVVRLCPRHSKDLEMIEVVSPAEFKTSAVAAPAARRSPDRRSRG